MENIVALITALGIGGLLSKVIDWYIEKKKAEATDDKAFTTVFAAVHEVYYALQIMLRDSQAFRIVVLKTTNGGGRPRLTGGLYSSVMYEAFEAPLNSTKASWQNQPLDYSYMEVLFEMNKTGKMLLITDQLRPGILKDLYEKDGITMSLVFRITEREKEYIYMSANFTGDPGNGAAINDMFRVGVNQLRTIFDNNETI